jgi:DNA uptake protein ComE-like DNA-binding protein
MKKFLSIKGDTNSGMAVILLIGVLAILALVAISFAINARLELQTAESYSNSVKAKYLAEAGIHHAIAELKNDARNNFAYNDNVSISGEQSLGEGVYTVNVIEDEARRININNTENPNLEQLLKNLKNAIITSLTDADCKAIAENAPYETKEQIKTVSGIGDAKYNNIKNYITLYSYKNSNCSDRSPININTAADVVLKAVLTGISDGTTIISSADADSAVTAIINNRPFAHPDGWMRFEELVDDTLGSPDKTEVIVNNCNPNGDKSSLNTQTTEFIFSSGGYYSIESTAQLKEGAKILAERRLKTIVKIYDIWNQTTKEEFLGEGLGDEEKPIADKVNWKDSCPIDYDSLKTHIYDPDDAITIPNALKIGFWDDFEEDYGTVGTDTGDWIALQESFSINQDGDGLFRTWPPGTFVAGDDYFPLIELNKDKWRFDDFSIRIRLIDEASQSKTTLRDNLPWPAVPQGWEGQAPMHSVPSDPPGTASSDSYERWMNVSHLQFGDTVDWARNPAQHSAIYLGFPQNFYEEWVYVPDYPELDYPDREYDYIYFAPLPVIKAENIITNPHVYIFINDWYWWGHDPVDGTKTFSVSSYESSKTFQFRSKGQRDLKGAVYYSSDSTSFDTGNEPLFTYQDRYIRLSGMGSLLDADNIRIIPQDPDGGPGGSYTSVDYNIGETIEQGTVSGTVFLLDTVAPNTRVELSFASPNFSTSVQYQADFYSLDNDIEDTPVLEDVFVTYLKPTKFLYYTEVSN